MRAGKTAIHYCNVCKGQVCLQKFSVLEIFEKIKKLFVVKLIILIYGSINNFLI